MLMSYGYRNNRRGGYVGIIVLLVTFAIIAYLSSLVIKSVINPVVVPSPESNTSSSSPEIVAPGIDMSAVKAAEQIKINIEGRNSTGQ
jgi:hypothetical protein